MLRDKVMDTKINRVESWETLDRCYLLELKLETNDACIMLKKKLWVRESAEQELETLVGSRS